MLAPDKTALEKPQEMRSQSYPKGNMNKYYREIHKDEKPIEVDDIPEVKELKGALRACTELYESALAESDPWHPASDPPKAEDFEPTGHILVIGGSSKARCLKRLSCKPIYTHWRKITPP